MRARAVLFGPFVGELSWEFFRFAPHAIYLKKNDPNLRIIVLTRESRFDLYGQYSDILLPLRIKDDNLMERDCYKLKEYKEEYYNIIVKFFNLKFKKRYNIINHIYPDIRMWRYKVKWQLPRNKMDYNFKPREDNIEIGQDVIGSKICIVDNHAVKYKTENENFIDSTYLCEKINNELVKKDNTTMLGCLIESLRKCKYVIGNINSDISHLSVLLGVPLIHIGKTYQDDFFNLLNPLNTPIIAVNNINEGIKIYENNF